MGSPAGRWEYSLELLFATGLEADVVSFSERLKVVQKTSKDI